MLKSSLYLGLMSGTSMDGIDVALLDVKKQRLVAAHKALYNADLVARLKKLTYAAEKAELGLIYQTNRLVGEAFAQAANDFIIKIGIDKNNIRAIGSHGQTIIHAPSATPSYTVQLGCPFTIAARTGLAVVADFRTKDLVLGGQGAPLAPLYHQEVFKKLVKPLAIVNIGGIANITFLLPKNIVKGYDVGPGNCIIDAFVENFFGIPYDKNGDLAASGEVIPSLLNSLLQDPFFSQKSPKSLDKEYFSLSKISHLFTDLSKNNIQATLTAFTAHAISLAIKQEDIALNHLLVCGGGVHNNYLMNTLKSSLRGIKVESSAAYNVSPDYLEAMMCAWIAHRCIQKRPIVLNNVTGGETTILGAIYES